MNTQPPPVGLQWEIKRSFLAYVARSPDGRAGVSDGATATPQNEVLFPLDAESHPPVRGPSTFLAFRGAITFTAHFGMLFVRIADPWVTIQDTLGKLTVTDEAARAGGQRIQLATFTVADHAITDGFERWSAADVQLASEGSEVFNDVYQVGEALEPFTIIVPAPSVSPAVSL